MNIQEKLKQHMANVTEICIRELDIPHMHAILMQDKMTKEIYPAILRKSDEEVRESVLIRIIAVEQFDLLSLDTRESLKADLCQLIEEIG